ncbi:tRNA (adenosine(37)-N6)-threonylcarbamoyltransferase complex transferase subunit TsaD, partial [Candidatus Peregrinibacteria bacterium]|nr:tRNA (adenosine(37)-N6)-threonylcarbamoyltransferase complex transferase subunit TsaD [Candidatus Peregrinibacteria bacterium]
MRILGIETSCDETAAAVVEDGIHVLSNVIASAKDAFLWSGGVIPEEAARKQVECVLPIIAQTLSEAHITHEDLDAIAVTKGPGLLGSLIVGTVTARILAAMWQKPLIGIHHHFGHLSSTWLRQKSEARFPILTLTVSGGHTELWLRTAHTSGELLGQTRDDAAGEAFDKGACLLGLPYPGGPAIAEAAENGNPSAFAFPHPLHSDTTLDFSFSGLKTSLKYLLRDSKH